MTDFRPFPATGDVCDARGDDDAFRMLRLPAFPRFGGSPRFCGPVSAVLAGGALS
jgi:hypothetical protein